PEYHQKGQQHQHHQAFAAAWVAALGVVAAQQGHVALVAFVGKVKHIANNRNAPYYGINQDIERHAHYHRAAGPVPQHGQQQGY
nr:hypothetical protein [Tanacetum cinerariifolium]